MKRNLYSQRGVSLVEVLIVMAVMILLAVAMTGGLNPTTQVNKGYDARMKKDLARIKVAFEEYYNDKGCYPDPEYWNFSSRENCGKPISDFSWLNLWPCQPDGTPYRVVVEGGSCPKWFKVFANLSNKKDSDIPSGWYDTEFKLAGDVTNLLANYGMSSTNVSWYEKTIPLGCFVDKVEGKLNGCYYRYYPHGPSGPYQCESIGSGEGGGDMGCGEDKQCYIWDNCVDYCRVRTCTKYSYSL